MNKLKNLFKSFPLTKKVLRDLDNKFVRDDFVIEELKNIPSNKVILDAGCGSQRYRPYCSHLNYKAQDFKQ
jgi:hypothetical protein